MFDSRSNEDLTDRLHRKDHEVDRLLSFIFHARVLL